MHIAMRARGVVLQPELHRRDDVQDHRRQQDGADSPQRDHVRRAVQKRRVAIDLFVIAGINLEISEQMADHVAEENHAA